jgi:NADH-quinone oxidoreductase subunit C
MSVTAIGALEGFATTTSADGTQSVFPDLGRYHPLISQLRDSGFEMLVDLCGVDYLGHPGRRLPEGVAPERFEVVVNMLSLSQKRRVRVRVQVSEHTPVIDSLFDLYPGSEAMEREAFDLIGIRFAGHPDLTRILMPDDWEGHPLRKDYGIGRIPVQFKETPGPR